MSSANFLQAQERVLERRRLREAAANAGLKPQRPGSAYYNRSSAILQQWLPYPLNRLTESGETLWYNIFVRNLAGGSREGTRPSFRVGQVDAELLDEELLHLLKAQVGEGLKYFGVCIPFPLSFFLFFLSC